MNDPNVGLPLTGFFVTHYLNAFAAELTDLCHCQRSIAAKAIGKFT